MCLISIASFVNRRIIYIYIYIYIVRTKRSYGPNPLRIVRCTVQLWPKSIKFVKEGNEQQEKALPKDEDREENVNFIE